MNVALVNCLSKTKHKNRKKKKNQQTVGIPLSTHFFVEKNNLCRFIYIPVVNKKHEIL